MIDKINAYLAVWVECSPMWNIWLARIDC